MSSILRVAASAAALAASATIATIATAQPRDGAVPSAAAAASAPSASAAPPGYRSAFEGYRPFGEQPLVSWRQANDLVGKIGGWQAYAREGQGGPTAGDASARAGAGADKPMSSMPGVEGHGMSAMPGMSMPVPRAGAPMAMPSAASSPLGSKAPIKATP